MDSGGAGMKISEHANYLLNEFGRLQFDYAAYCKPNGESLRNEARNNLETYIAELEAERRWIPVSERLPDNWESVLTIDISKSTRGPVTAFYNPETSLWATHFSCDLWVTHWMPLPEPPIVYGKVCPEVQE